MVVSGFASFNEAAKHAPKEAPKEEPDAPHTHVEGTGHVRIVDIYGFIIFLGLSSIVTLSTVGIATRYKQEDESVEANARGPDMNTARAMASVMSEYSNDTLVILSETGVHAACRERLAREIMRADNFDWANAQQTITEIEESWFKLVAPNLYPYALGIGAAAVTAAASIPIVYSRTVVEFTNDNFVTSEVPEPHEMDTIREVGGWSWNWMEPLLGTSAAVILCMQLVRSMMSDIGMLAWHEKARMRTSNQLAELFPQYRKEFVRAFANTANVQGEGIKGD